MRAFDLVKMESTDEAFAKRLGYSRIFTRKEIEVRNWPDKDSGKKFIIASKDPGMLGRAVRRENVLGVIIEDSMLFRKVINDAAENDKLICFNTTQLTCVDQKARMRNLHRMRNLFWFAVRSRAKVAVLTLSEEKYSMLSSIQLLEMAKLIGADGKRAKEMLETIGMHYDN